MKKKVRVPENAFSDYREWLISMNYSTATIRDSISKIYDFFCYYDHFTDENVEAYIQKGLELGRWSEQHITHLRSNFWRYRDFLTREKSSTEAQQLLFLEEIPQEMSIDKIIKKIQQLDKEKAELAEKLHQLLGI